jgi:hypothetical protein
VGAQSQRPSLSVGYQIVRASHPSYCKKRANRTLSTTEDKIMAFKTLFIAHAPDADKEKHHSFIDTGKYQLDVVIVKNQAGFF